MLTPLNPTHLRLSSRAPVVAHICGRLEWCIGVARQKAYLLQDGVRCIRYMGLWGLLVPSLVPDPVVDADSAIADCSEGTPA